MKHIGFLSFGHWTPSPQSQTRSAADALLQSIELAVAAEKLGADGAYFRVHHFARQLGSPFPLLAACGAHQDDRDRHRGHRHALREPIELERYCTSNKIWTTKVKRLRLPDIQCVRTGLRIEVRAKTDLRIRMSDAPTNPDRRWASGLRDEDLCGFIACVDNNGTPEPAAEAVFFTVKDLKKTEDSSELGPPKSASEGAERDRTWPSIVPSRSGIVEYVDKTILRVTMAIYYWIAWPLCSSFPTPRTGLPTMRWILI